MNQFNYHTGNLPLILNLAKDMLLDELERQQMLKGSSERLKQEWAFVAVEKGWWGTTLDKLLYGNADGAKNTQVRLVKILSHAEPEYKARLRPQTSVSHLKLTETQKPEDEKKE